MTKDDQRRAGFTPLTAVHSGAYKGSHEQQRP